MIGIEVGDWGMVLLIRKMGWDLRLEIRDLYRGLGL